MTGERPNKSLPIKKNIESLNLTRKVNLLRLWRGKVDLVFFIVEYLLAGIFCHIKSYRI